MKYICKPGRVTENLDPHEPRYVSSLLCSHWRQGLDGEQRRPWTDLSLVLALWLLQARINLFELYFLIYKIGRGLGSERMILTNLFFLDSNFSLLLSGVEMSVGFISLGLLPTCTVREVVISLVQLRKQVQEKFYLFCPHRVRWWQSKNSCLGFLAPTSCGLSSGNAIYCAVAEIRSIKQFFT